MAYTENVGGLRTAVRLIHVVCFFFCLLNFVDSNPLNSKKVAEGIVSINCILSSFIMLCHVIIHNIVVHKLDSNFSLLLCDPLGHVSGTFRFCVICHGHQTAKIQTCCETIKNLVF